MLTKISNFLQTVIYVNAFTISECIKTDQNYKDILGFRDPLTKLATRRYMEIWLMHKKPLSVIFIDLDNFKDFNTKYTHIIADNTLRKVGEFINAIKITSNNLRVRFGGDEAVLFIESDTETESICRQLKYGSYKATGITFSIGSGSTISEANSNLFKSKAAGKNWYTL